MTGAAGTTTVRVGVSADRIRAILTDADALGRVLPGCEAAEAVGPGRFRLVLATRVGFLTVRADVDAVLDEPAPHRLRLTLDGRTRGIDGGFTAAIPFELVGAGPAATTVTYAVAVTTSGAVALAGEATVEAAIRGLADDLVAALEREAAGG